MRTILQGLFVFLCASSPLLANEAQVASDYDRLSRIPAKYEVFGTICEYLTRFRLEAQYPTPDYKIEVGIEYRVHGRTIGEIDVVVFRARDQEAVLVGQVKCRKNMSSARSHAHEQNERFRHTMEQAAQRAAVTFRSTSDPDLVVTQDQMDEVETYITASQDGGERVGFSMTVGHDLDTVSAMRDRLLACQENGRCPQPH